MRSVRSKCAYAAINLALNLVVGLSVFKLDSRLFGYAVPSSA